MTVEGKTNHLDFNKLKQEPMPSVTDVTRLVKDAIANKKDRFGSVLSLDGETACTTTGIEVTVSWDELKLNQMGSDRHFIDWSYKVHYLQWTPWRLGNYVLSLVGLLLLVVQTAKG